MCWRPHSSLCMRKITSALNVAINVLPPSYNILAIWQHLGLSLATFSLRMRRNSYLWISGENIDINIRLLDPDFHMENDMSAIWRHLLSSFALDKLNVRHISTSGLVDLLTLKVGHVLRSLPHDGSFHHIRSRYNYPLSSYSVIAVDTLRDLVTLIFDILTLVSGHTWRVTWSTAPRSYEIWHPP